MLICSVHSSCKSSDDDDLIIYQANYFIPQAVILFLFQNMRSLCIDVFGMLCLYKFMNDRKETANLIESMIFIWEKSAAVKKNKFTCSNLSFNITSRKATINYA